MSLLKLNKNWIVGFVDGEGCFHTSIVRVQDMKLGKRPISEFVVTQHRRSLIILKSLKDYFQCGLIKQNHGDRDCFCVRDVKHLNEIIVPFFLKNKLLIKDKELKVFQKLVQMTFEKKHLTPEGLDVIENLSKKLKDLKKVA